MLEFIFGQHDEVTFMRICECHSSYYRAVVYVPTGWSATVIKVGVSCQSLSVYG